MASAEIIALLNSESEGEEPPAFAMDESLAAAGWHASDAPGASAFQAIDLGSNNSDEDPYADPEVTAMPQEDSGRRQREGSTSKELGGDGGGGSSGGSAAVRLTGSSSSINSLGDDTPAFFHAVGPGTPESESTATGSSLDALDTNDRPHPSLCDGVYNSPHDRVEELRKGNSDENPGKSGDIVEQGSETKYVQNDRRSLTIVDEIERLSGDEGAASPILARGEEDGATAVPATFAGGNEEERCREDLQDRAKGAVSDATDAGRGWPEAETEDYGGGFEGATVGAAVQESRVDTPSSLGANDSAAAPCLEQTTVSSSVNSSVGAEMESGSGGPFDPSSHAGDDESLQSIIDSLPSGFVQCPGCPNVYELVPNEDAARGGSSGLAAQDLPKGATFSRRAAMRHNGRHRFRCPACSSCFCGSCRATPYHFGFDCAGWKAHQAKPKCTFCGNSAVDPEGASTGDVHNVDDDQQPIPCCEEAECRQRASEGCRKKLPCGHPCRGPGASDCLPCLESGCSSAEIDGDAEFCNVCWTEALVAAPCVKLGCGHFVHVSCGREQLRRGRPTARLTFGFMSCPVCRADKALARHPYLGKLDGIDEQLKLAHEVEELALQRLRADELPPLKRSPMENLAKMRRRMGPHFRPRDRGSRLALQMPYPPLNAGINLQRRMQPAVRFPPVFPERWARAEPGEWQPLAGLAMDWMPPFFRGPFASSPPPPPPPPPPYVGGQGGAAAALAMAVAAAPAASARAAEDSLGAAGRESSTGRGGAAGGGLGGAPSSSYSEEHHSYINRNRAMPIAHADAAVARSLEVLDVGRGMSDDSLSEEMRDPEDAGRGLAYGLMEFKRAEEFRNSSRLRSESLRSQPDSNKHAEKSSMEDNWPPHDEFRHPSRWVRGIMESPNMGGGVAGIAGGSGSGGRDGLSELQRRRASGNPPPLAEDPRRTRRMLEESLEHPAEDGSSGKRKLLQREIKYVKSEQVQEAWGWGPGSRGWRGVDGRPSAHRGISSKNHQEEGWDGRDSTRSRGAGGGGNDPSDPEWIGRGAEVRAVGAEDCLDRISAHSSLASPPGSSEQGPPQRENRAVDPAQSWLHMFPRPVHMVRSTAPRENKVGTNGARDVRRAVGTGRGARYDAPVGSDDEVIILERRGRKSGARIDDQLSACARKQVLYGASHGISASPPPPSPFDGLSPSPPSPLSSPRSRSPEELLVDWFPDHSPRLAPSPPAKGREDAGLDWVAAAFNGHDGLAGRNASDKRSREDREDGAANAEGGGAIELNDDLRPKFSKRVHFAAAGNNEKKKQQQQRQLHVRPFHGDGRGAFGEPWVFGGAPDMGLGPAFRIDKQARKKQAGALAEAIAAAAKSAAENEAKHGAEGSIERRDGWKDGKIDLAAKGMYSLRLHVTPASSGNGGRVDEDGRRVSAPRAVGHNRAQLDAGSASERPEASKKEDSQTVSSTAEVTEVAHGKEDRTEMVSRALKRGRSSCSVKTRCDVSRPFDPPGMVPVMLVPSGIRASEQTPSVEHLEIPKFVQAASRYRSRPPTLSCSLSIPLSVSVSVYEKCHSCRKPYFGGLVSCEPAVPPSEGGVGAGAAGGGARGWDAAIGPAGRDGDALAAERAVEDVKAQELLCGKCSASNGGADCPEHGQEFMEHKCYWCCRKVASYFCGGVMHFCDICHLHGFAAKSKPCLGGIMCLFGGHHPERARNGQDEFVLGCGICRPKPGEEEVDGAEPEPAGQ